MHAYLTFHIFWNIAHFLSFLLNLQVPIAKSCKGSRTIFTLIVHCVSTYLMSTDSSCCKGLQWVHDALMSETTLLMFDTMCLFNFSVRGCVKMMVIISMEIILGNTFTLVCTPEMQRIISSNYYVAKHYLTVCYSSIRFCNDTKFINYLVYSYTKISQLG